MSDKENRGWNDEKIEVMMGTLLRSGVIASALIVIAGGVLFFIQHAEPLPSYQHFTGEPDRLRQVSTIIKEAFDFRGRPLIQLGLLLLIATPIARVIFSLVGFAIEKDYTYIVISFIVLSVLLYSVFVG